MKIYNQVKKLLETNEQTRNSDKLLVAEVLRSAGLVKQVIYFGDREAVLLDNLVSKNTPTYESITRARRKIQEIYPHLRATSSDVRRKRKQKQDTKGTFIYKETL